jgi:predicted dehydrogenase
MVNVLTPKTLSNPLVVDTEGRIPRCLPDPLCNIAHLPKLKLHLEMLAALSCKQNLVILSLHRIEVEIRDFASSKKLQIPSVWLVSHCWALACTPKKVSCNRHLDSELKRHNIGSKTDILVAYLPSLHANQANLVAVYSRSLKAATETVEEAKKLPGLVSPAIGIYNDEQPDHDLDELLKREDVKAVIISLPTLIQPAIALKALAAGKHVLMEKPLAKDIQASEDLITEYEAKYKSKGLILSVAEQFRYDAGHEKARQIVASGRIGKLAAVHARIWQLVVPGNKWYETEWRKRPQYQGGFLLDGGVHFVAFIRHVASDEIVETAAFAKQTLEYLPPLDTVQAALKFKSGATGTLSISFASAKGEYSYIFIGSEGSLTATGEGGGTKLIVQDAKGKVVSDEILKSTETYKELFLAFFDATETGKGDVRGSPKQALADIAVVESICSGGGKVKIYT